MQNEIQDDFKALRSLLRQAMTKLSVLLVLAASAVCAAPVISYRKGDVEICDDLSPLLDDPDRSIPKVATSWEWLPQSGNVGLVYRTEDGRRHVLELRPDLTWLSFRSVTVDGY